MNGQSEASATRIARPFPATTPPIALWSGRAPRSRWVGQLAPVLAGITHSVQREVLVPTVGNGRADGLGELPGNASNAFALMNNMGVEGKLVADLGQSLDVNRNVYTKSAVERWKGSSRSWNARW